MQSYLVVTAIGPHSTDLVQQFSQIIKECGCNIIEGRVTTMGKDMCLSMMLSGSWDTIAKVESALPKLENKLALSLQFKRTDTLNATENMMPYAIDVVSYDHPGVVHDITRFIAKNEIIIQDMHTNTYPAQHSGTPMFSLHMTINIPTTISIASLRGEFMDFCDQLNLDAIMEPVK